MKNKAIQWGLFSGIVLVLLNIVLFLIGQSVFITYGGYILWILNVGLLVHLTFMTIANKNHRNALGGAMTIKEGFKNAWQVFAIASIFEGILAYILFNFVDSGLYQVLLERQLEWISWSCDISQINPCLALQDAKKVTVDDFKLTIGTILYTMAYRLIIPGALIAILVAAMTRREDIS